MSRRPCPPTPQRPDAETVAPEEIDAAVIRHGGFIEGTAAIGLNYATASRLLLAAFGPPRGGDGAARKRLQRLVAALGPQQTATEIGGAPLEAVLAWAEHRPIPPSVKRAIDRTAKRHGLGPRACVAPHPLESPAPAPVPT